MPLARVVARTDSTTRYSYNARRGQLPRTRIGVLRRTRARHMQYAPRVCTLVLFIYIRIDDERYTLSSVWISAPLLRRDTTVTTSPDLLADISCSFCIREQSYVFLSPSTTINTRCETFWNGALTNLFIRNVHTQLLPCTNYYVYHIHMDNTCT